jgi:gliding motility-associated-like protein
MTSVQQNRLLRRHSDVQAQHQVVSRTKKIWFKLFWLRCGEAERGFPAFFCKFLGMNQIGLVGLFGKHRTLLRTFAASAVVMSSALMTQAQSVVNGSFEQLDAPPNNSGQWSLVPGWSNAGSAVADPDAYHLDGSAGGDLPETPVAIVQPYHGRGLMGFQATGPAGTNSSEYLRGTFDQPLTPGQRYEFSFHITNGDLTAFSTAGFGVSGLGVAFSHGNEVQVGQMALAMNPTFRMTSVLYDNAWREIKFVFTATQGWTHFTLGLLGPDPGEVSYIEGNNAQMAYYFVDYFQIAEAPEGMDPAADQDKGEEEDEAVAPNDGINGPGWFVPNAFTPNSDGENDAFLPVVETDVSVRRFELYNRWGQVIWKWEPGDAGWDGTIAGGAVRAETGVYIWKMQVKDASGKRSEETGQVALIR